MSTLLERLLEWLAALHSPVVLLSATLPNARRQALCAAYARGLGYTLAQLPNAPYPRITQADGHGEGHATAITMDRSDEPVVLHWVEDGNMLIRRLHDALANGGCVAVICNTVTRAQHMYSALRDYFSAHEGPQWVELDLLHARFPYEERERREQAALAGFAKPNKRSGDAHRPTRAILVSTQIIEQSLDLDFDLMITDLAPADLVLQRAGRLHRHSRQRPPGLEHRPLWIIEPDLSDDVDPTFDKGSTYVYDPHVLLRSWLALRNRATIAIPDSVQDLIEEVYDDREPPDDLPPALQTRWTTTLTTLRREQVASKHSAQGRDLRPPSFDEALWKFVQAPLIEDAPELNAANQALTREGDPSVSVVVLNEATAHDLIHSTPSVPEATALLRRSVSLSHGRIVHSLLETPVPSGWARSPLLRSHRPLVLSDDGQTTIGNYIIRLDPELGITITKESA